MMRDSRGNGARGRFSRREFFEAAGIAGVMLGADPSAAAELGAELPTHHFKVRRDFDLLDLEFSFVNFEVQRTELVALGAGRSLVIVRFPPQNLAEAIFDKPAKVEPFENTPLPLAKCGSSANSPVPPIRCFLSGPSWVVFVAPNGLRLPFRSAQSSQRGGRHVVDSWLRVMADWKIRIPRIAETPGTPSMPRFDETCLEIPFRLMISPTSSATRWLTSSEQLAGVDARAPSRHELWHAALLSRKELQPAVLPPGVTNITEEMEPPKRIAVQARAVFSPDYSPDRAPAWERYYPGRMQLSSHALTRHALVKQQMIDKNGWLDAEHIILSALGCDASLSYMSQVGFKTIIERQLAGDKDENDPKLAIYKHRIVIGRDQFILEAYFGFLMPFAYPALAIELTRREFVSHYLQDCPGPYGPPGAYLLKERFILVQDPVKQFNDSGSMLGRLMPLKKAVVADLRSPPLANWSDYKVLDRDLKENVVLKDEFKPDELQRIRDGLFFVPRELTPASTPPEVRWTVDFQDESGQPSRSTDACFLFAQHIVLGQKLWQVLNERYRRWEMPGQPIAFAPERAELTVIADKETETDKKEPVEVGQVLARHTLDATERSAARQLAEGIRGWLANQAGNPQQVIDALEKKFNGWKNSIPSAQALAEKFGIKEVQSLRHLQPKTITEIVGLANRITEKVNDKRAAFEDLIRQLQRAEQVSSTLETHALVFDCQPVKHLFDSVRNDLAPILKQADSVDAFVKRVNALPQLPDSWKKQIESDVMRRIKPLEKNFRIAKQELQAYVDELTKARDDAVKIGNEFFQAQLNKADVVIPALKAVADGTPIREIKHLEDYIAKGISELGLGNSRVQNGVFAHLTQAVDQGKAMADHIRSGVVRPAAIVSGLSRDVGAVLGKGKEAVENFSRELNEFKADTVKQIKEAIPDSKLLGVVPLRDLIGSLARGQVPSINLVNLPDHYEHIWSWTAPLGGKDLGILKFEVSSNANARVCLHITSTTRVERPTAGDLANPKVRGRVLLRGYLGFWDEPRKAPSNEPSIREAFALRLLELVLVKFKQIDFSADAPLGEAPKPEFKPVVQDVEFLGPLKFLMDLQKGLLGGLAGDRVKVDVKPEGVTARFAFELPPISIAVVSLRNLKVGASLALSFAEKPLRFDFNFSSFQEPAEISVLCFSGRAFFRAALMTDGKRELEGALEFGGALSFDVVVARGGLYVMAGIYFKITNDMTELSGFLRAGGTLSVLGLIHASVEFMLMVRYRSYQGSNELYGICVIHVSIDLFLFSIDVAITMEKRIAGSSDRGRPATTQLHRGDRYFVSHQAGAAGALVAPALPPPPEAYFSRDPVPGSSNQVQGCWENEAQWNAQYWSQFL